MKLHTLIFAGMGLGAVAGLGLWSMGDGAPLYASAMWFLDLVGKTLFVGSLKMLVAPLIFASIVAGVTSLPSRRDLGRLGRRAFFYYAATTSVAVLIGLIFVNVLQPGRWEAADKISSSRATHLEQVEREFLAERGVQIEERLRGLSQSEALEERARIEAKYHPEFLERVAELEQSGMQGDASARYEKIQQRKQTPLNFVTDILQGMIQNPFKALAFNSSLGIIFFAILLGLACMAVGEPAAPVVSFFQGLNAVIMQITHWIMSLSPVAVFALVAGLIARQGPDVFGTLAGYVVTVIAAIGVHVVFLLFVCAKLGGLSPLTFLKGIQDAWLIAFSTRSSAATLPVTMECLEENLGIPKKVTEFVLPIGATVNMDGTALYEGVAVIFLLQMFGAMPDVGISLGVTAMVLIFLTAVLASVGAAAVPDAGLITMVLVANAVGLPEYYLVYIFSVDALLDMFRTSTNVMGDAVGAVVVNRFEEQPA
ncbi:MAG: cation:dicarboxylase symporter family transporter [Chrysiogenetes bacterium]|nr:cation:dicarboxylase symporter family transporter [Chrysiogenetes bacterium]